MNLLKPIMASDVVKAERRAICLECEHLRGVTMTYCNVCKCPIQGKTALASSRCPIGKWEAEKAEDNHG